MNRTWKSWALYGVAACLVFTACAVAIAQALAVGEARGEVKALQAELQSLKTAVQQQTAVLHRALGKHIPLALPEARSRGRPPARRQGVPQDGQERRRRGEGKPGGGVARPGGPPGRGLRQEGPCGVREAPAAAPGEAAGKDHGGATEVAPRFPG